MHTTSLQMFWMYTIIITRGICRKSSAEIALQGIYSISCVIRAPQEGISKSIYRQTTVGDIYPRSFVNVPDKHRTTKISSLNKPRMFLRQFCCPPSLKKDPSPVYYINLVLVLRQPNRFIRLPKYEYTFVKKKHLWEQ